MKHDDNTLQAAIDAAMLETKTGTQHNSLDTYVSNYWHRESPARLALAKAFLAKLPEPQPILADDGRSLGQVAYEAKAHHQFETTALRAPTWEVAESYVKSQHIAMAQAVASIVLSQAILRMEAVSHSEITNAYWQEGDGYENIRARLIAAARGEAVGINGLTEAEEVQTASVAGLSKTASSTFEAHGKTWNCHTPSDPRPCSGDSIINIYCEGDIKEHAMIRCRASALDWSCQTIRGWRYADKLDSTDWKAKYEQAEAELAALKSSQIGIIRPLAEAGPVPDGCVRINGHFYADRWYLGWQKDDKDTHFADIRLPVTETPAPVNEQPKQHVPLGPEDVMPGSVIRCDNNHWFQVLYASSIGVCINNVGLPVQYRWTELTERWQINRSIPLTGKWDANAWEPCSKPAWKEVAK